MKIVVVMDEADTVDPATDTSFALIEAAQERDHAIWHCDAVDVEFVAGRVWARARPATADRASPQPLRLGAAERLDLGAVDAVLVRTDPPFDAAYLHLTLLLDLLGADTAVVNEPRGLRDANEKLYACRFPELMPATIVTADRSRLVEFSQSVGGAVLKPIDGHGGRGVMAVRPGDDNAGSIIDTLTDRGRRSVVAQQFLPRVVDGDKRILLLDGRPLGAILRVPADREFRANIGVGATTVAAELDDTDRKIVDTIAPALRADGLVFVGIDVVDGHLTEVNVTSPTGICQLAALTNTRPDLEVIRWLEHRVS